jgi:hypothetical protein
MPDAIDGAMMEEMSRGMPREQKEYAYAVLLATYCGLDTEYNQSDKVLFHERFVRMVHAQDTNDYTSDPFYCNIKIPETVYGEWELKTEKLKPYEAFLINETDILKDGSIIPKVGFFEEEFIFPAVLQNGREWMTITPHEINSTLPAVRKSRGKVATYGLGLGYFAYMAAIKENVSSVTIVEKDEAVIDLFEKFILPQFPYKDKIKIVCADAFEYAEKCAPKENFDFVFADTWHDPLDGIEMYEKFKSLEHLCPSTEFSYWIEKTVNYYRNLTEEDAEPTSGKLITFIEGE